MAEMEAFGRRSTRQVRGRRPARVSASAPTPSWARVRARQQRPGLVLGWDLDGGGAVVDALEVDLGRQTRLAVQPVLGREGRLEADGGQVNVGLERLCAARHGEGDGARCTSR